MQIGNNTSFINNSADSSGAGIKWDQIEPIFGTVLYSGNKATLYGNNIGSFA